MANDAGIFNQTAYRVRFEWGVEGIKRLAVISEVVVIIDVLSFTTCVEVAVSRDVAVFPYQYKDDSAKAFARSVRAMLAGQRGVGPSLSPASLLAIPFHSRLVLPSPNGSACTLIAQKLKIPVLAGCLRNAQAIADFINRQYPRATVSIIACGEQWPNGMLRPAIEDFIGAGAILSQFDPRGLSPEAAIARGAYEHVKTDVPTILQECGSGRELATAGFPEDVTIASEANVSRTVPVFLDGAYRPSD